MQSAWKRWLLCTFGGQAIVLTLAMAPCVLLALMLAWLLQGREVLGMVAITAGICYAATLVAMTGEHWFAVRHFALLGIFWAMAFRTGIPLVAAVLLMIRGGPLAKPWIICYLGAFYLVALTVHLALSYYSINAIPPITKLDNPSK
jgi:hypothetical protein